MTARLKPLDVEVFTWNGQDPATWPDWVNAISLGIVGVSRPYVAFVPNMIIRDGKSAFIVEPGESLVRIAGTDKAMTLSAEDLAARVDFDEAPTPSPAPAPIPAPPPLANGAAYPPKPYVPQDHVTALHDFKAGDSVKQFANASGTHVIDLGSISFGSTATMLVDALNGDTDLIYFRAADGNYYIGRYSTWTQWSAP